LVVFGRCRMLCLPLFVKKPEKFYMYGKKVGKLFGYLKYFAYFCSVIGKQAVKCYLIHPQIG
jgi:hypothetical protein